MLPKEVIIGPYPYRLDMRFGYFKWENSDEELYGHCSPSTQVITIADGIPKERQQAVVIHECLHALLELSGIAVDGDQEETFITKMSPIILMWMKDNPKLIKYLTE